MAALHTFRNEELGLEATVSTGPRGFHVRLTDTDAGETLPVTECYPQVEDAIRSAQRMVA